MSGIAFIFFLLSFVVSPLCAIFLVVYWLRSMAANRRAAFSAATIGLVGWFVITILYLFGVPNSGPLGYNFDGGWALVHITYPFAVFGIARYAAKAVDATDQRA